LLIYNLKIDLFILTTLVYSANLFTDFSDTNSTVSYRDALDRLRVHLNIRLSCCWLLRRVSVFWVVWFCVASVVFIDYENDPISNSIPFQTICFRMFDTAFGCVDAKVSLTLHLYNIYRPILSSRSVRIRFLVKCDHHWWLGGATSKSLDVRSSGRGFDCGSASCQVTTLCKLFTPMCQCK